MDCHALLEPHHYHCLAEKIRRAQPSFLIIQFLFVTLQIVVIMSSALKDGCVSWIRIVPLRVCAQTFVLMTTDPCVVCTSGNLATFASSTSSLVESASWWELNEGEIAIWKVCYERKKNIVSRRRRLWDCFVSFLSDLATPTVSPIFSRITSCPAGNETQLLWRDDWRDLRTVTPFSIAYAICTSRDSFLRWCLLIQKQFCAVDEYAGKEDLEIQEENIEGNP